MVAPLAALGIGAGASVLGSFLGGGAAKRAADQAAQTSFLGLMQARRAGREGQMRATDAADRAAAAAERAASTVRGGLGRARERAARAETIAREATEAGIGRLDPFAQGGLETYGQLQAERDALTSPFTLADFEASPGYQFRLQQGEDAINRAAAARGNFFAPASVRALNEFNQGLASTEFENAFLRNRQTRQDRLNALMQGTQIGFQGASNIADLAQRGAGQQIGAVLSVPELQGAAQAGAFEADAGRAFQTGAGQAIAALTGVPYVQGAGQAAGFQQAGGNALAAGLAGGLNTFGNTAVLGGVLNSLNRGSTFSPTVPGLPGGFQMQGTPQINPNPSFAPTIPGFWS